MSLQLKEMISNLTDSNLWERKKLFFLSCIFFLIIGAYTIIRDLKNSIFIWTVGEGYQPIARIIFFILLLPALLAYSKFVDKARRYYLLMGYSIFYAILCLIFAFFVNTPTIGLLNTNQSPYRLFGWIFYFFSEGFPPFVLSVFWAFANSINSPENAKKNYGFMVSGSKLGGMFSASIAWLLFSSYAKNFSEASRHQLILFLAAFLLLMVPLLIYFLIKTIPGHCLHGYEAVYKIEKERGKKGKSDTGIWAGFTMLLQYPYVFGIFFMIFSYEVFSSILSFLRLIVAKKETMSVGETSGFLFKWAFIMHFIGFFISFLGTNALLRKWGVRTCLILIPIIMGFLAMLGVFSSPVRSFEIFNYAIAISPVMLAFTLIKSVHYAFAAPVIETLYIPTLKEIKFKSKSWIDSFGGKFGKLSASAFNHVAITFPALYVSAFSFFFGIIGLWFIIAFLLGIRFDKAVNNGEIIGFKAEND